MYLPDKTRGRKTQLTRKIKQKTCKNQFLNLSAFSDRFLAKILQKQKEIPHKTKNSIRREKEEESYRVLACWTSASSALSESLNESFPMAVEFSRKKEKKKKTLPIERKRTINQVESESRTETLQIVLIIKRKKDQKSKQKTKIS